MKHLQSLFTRRRIWIGAGLLLLIGLAVVLLPLLFSGPQLVQMLPAEGTTDANPQEGIRIEFDQWVLPGSVASAVVLADDQQQATGDLTTQWQGNAVVVRPASGLDYGRSYRLVLAGSIQNLLGRTTELSQTLAFATIPYRSVERLGPQDSAEAVSLDVPISVAFNAPVVPPEAVLADDMPQPLLLTPPVAGSGRWLTPQLYNFYPAAPLLPATTYTATVRADLTADGRMRLAEPARWSFTTAAPLLAGTRPYDRAESVPETSAIEVQLEPVVDVPAAAARFSLLELRSRAEVAGAFEYAEHSFRFVPAEPLQRGVRYRARLDAGVPTTAGTPINERPLSWTFTVVENLKVTSAEPEATLNQGQVPTDTQRIRVSFNHAVVEHTRSDLVPLTISPPLPGTGSWEELGTYVFSPTAALEPATTYTVQVAAGLRDQTGGTLPEDYRWQFTTLRPHVVAFLPASGDQYASPQGTVQISFNQPMNAASLRGGAIRLRDTLSGAAVPGVITVTNEMATFTPKRPLERGHAYELTVSRRARSLQNNARLDEAATTRFRVAQLPRLVRSSPWNGETNVDYNNSVSLYFNAPMDWQSVEQHLTISPEPASISVSGDAEHNRLYLYFPMQEQTDYTITVGAEARNQDGTRLGEATTISYRTQEPLPSLTVLSPQHIGLYNAHMPVRVPISHSSIVRFRYRLYRLAPAQAARLASTGPEEWGKHRPTADDMLREDEIVPQNETHGHTYSIVELGQVEAGTYLLEVSGTPTNAAQAHPASYRRDYQIMAVSPYAVTVKRSASDQLFVWAVDMETGQPAADLPLYAAPFAYDTQPTDAQLEQVAGSTDSDGILKTTVARQQPYETLYVWSSAEDGRFAFASSEWAEGIRPYNFDLLESYEPDQVLGNISTDRPIYRPEQTVNIRGALRLDQDGRYLVPEDGREATINISDPRGNSILAEQVPLSEFGTFTASLELEHDTPLGSFQVTAGLADDPNNEEFYGSFTVAEYRKPTFEVSVTPQQNDLLPGDMLTMDIDARYYFGGAVASAPIQWRLLAHPFTFASEAAPGFRFEDSADAYAWYRHYDDSLYGGEFIADGQATTDAEGHFRLHMPADLGDDLRGRRLVLDVEVTDVDEQVIAAQGRVTVHPGAFYIGLKPEGYVVAAGQPQTIAVATVDTQGQPHAWQDLEVGIYRRTWNSIREQGASGDFYWTSSYSDTLVLTQTITTDAAGEGSFSFTPEQSGSYRIVATGHDSAGHDMTSSAYSWVYGGGETFWGMDDTNRIDLVADKDSYRPGETASVLVATPYAGMQGLLTIERGEVIEHRLLTLQDTTDLLQLPINASHAPNIYLSLVLLRPSADPRQPPDMRVGMLNLPVSTEQQELTISLTPDKQQAAPGDQVTYTIQASDYSGAGVQAEIALALVDEAVLALATDPNPTLKESFYVNRPLGITTAQSLIALVDRITLALEPGGKGGGGGMDAEVLLRRNFPDTAYWNPALVTDENGRATVTVTLPDALTTWRMTARGITKDTRVGQASHELVVNRPLMVRAAIPRFLTVGDEPVLRAVVHNTTASRINATVAIDTGVLELDAPAEQALELAAGQEAVVAWPVKVGDADQAVLRFSVTGESASDNQAYRDAVEHVLPIQRYTAPETLISTGPVAENAVIPINATQLLAEGQQGELQLTLTPSLVAGLEQGLNYLDHYPHGCVEQTMSRFFPNAVISWLLELLRVDNRILQRSLDSNLEAGLQRLYVLQHLDGGWGWWENDDSQPYLTAYVVHGLLTVQKAGYSVDKHVLSQGIASLRKSLNSPLRPHIHSGDLSDMPLDARAYALFVLAEAGKPDRGRTTALYDRRAALDTYGLAYLLMTMASFEDEQERTHTLVSELMSRAVFDGQQAYWKDIHDNPWAMSSDTRTTALALQALVRADPENALVGGAVRHLMQMREDGHWRTTQESAVTLIALAEYVAQRGIPDAGYSYTAALDGRTLHEGTADQAHSQAVHITLPLADLQGSGTSQLTINRQTASGTQPAASSGDLYYSLSLRTYQDVQAVQPVNEKLAIERDYIAVDPATFKPTGQLLDEVQLGDVVQVRLRLSVPQSAQYVALEDMLPAGLEPLDTSLETVSTLVEKPEFAAEAGYSWWNVTHADIHDNQVALFATYLSPGDYYYTYMARATTAGSFQVLPARAYQMYEPDVYGQNAGRLFVVRDGGQE